MKQKKKLLLAELARIGKALASAPRLELLELLAQCEQPVEALAREAGLSLANTSHHLQVLRRARLVEGRKQGLFVRYSLVGPEVFSLTHAIRRLGESHLAEVERLVRTFFTSRDELEPLGRESLLERVREGSVVVLDVRPVEEYRAGHIPGAVSVPVSDLGRRIAELPADREVVAYCRGPYCVMAFEAVELLRAHGRRARRLMEGFPEWRAAGLPVEAAEEL